MKEVTSEVQIMTTKKPIKKTPWVVLIAYVLIDQTFHLSDKIIESFEVKDVLLRPILKLGIAFGLGILLMRIYESYKSNGAEVTRDLNTDEQGNDEEAQQAQNSELSEIEPSTTSSLKEEQTTNAISNHLYDSEVSSTASDKTIVYHFDELKTEDVPSKTFIDKYWIPLLILICLVLVFLRSRTNSIDVDTATIFGEATGTTFVVGLLFYFVIAKKVGSNAPAISFIAIFISCLIGSYAGMSQNKVLALSAIEKLQDHISELDKGKNGEFVAPDNHSTSTDNNDISEPFRYMNELMDKTRSIVNEYYAEGTQIGLNKLLDPNRLKDDYLLIESKLVLQRARNILSKYQQKYDAVIANIENDIRDLHMSESGKKNFLDGNRESNSSENKDSYWVLEGQLLMYAEKIINLLAGSKDGWVVEGSRLHFKNNSDLERYNYYFTQSKEVAVKENILKKSLSSELNEKLDKFKRTLK